MVRLFLILALILLPTVSKADYKWFDFAGGLYLDLSNSIINDSKIQFYSLRNNSGLSPISKEEFKSIINIQE